MFTENPIVAKFGGSSMADVDSIRQVASVIRSNPEIRFVVVSAPGKNGHYPTKTTDDLLGKRYGHVVERFERMGQELGLKDSVDWVSEAGEAFLSSNEDTILSRGEWLTAKVLAGYLGAHFVDAADILKVNPNGSVGQESYELIRKKFIGESGLVIIPGFYGRNQEGEITVFPRGGSDISGAAIARGVNARIYQNWTDVDGLKAADPRIIQNPKTITTITYKEIRELGYRGADVLQRDTVLPVFEAQIPINIRNTFNPLHPGTLIVAERRPAKDETVIGIAGRPDFMAFQIEMYGMNDELGVALRVLTVFNEQNVSFEHDPTGLDGMSVIVNQTGINGKEQKIIDSIKTAINPDKIKVLKNLGLLCAVGQGIETSPVSVLRKANEALEEAGVDISSVNLATPRNNIVFSLDQAQLNLATQALYDAFIE